MDYETIKEMWELTEGGVMPKDFRSICELYYKHKSVFHSVPFEENDFATCVVIYKLFKALTARKQKEKAK